MICAYLAKIKHNLQKFKKIEEKGGSMISAYLAKIKHNLQK